MEKEEPLISVIVPTYNRAHFLKEAIESVLAQTFIDWEYIIAVAGKMGWLNGLYFGLLVQSLVEKKLYRQSSIHEHQLEKMKAALPIQDTNR